MAGQRPPRGTAYPGRPRGYRPGTEFPAPKNGVQVQNGQPDAPEASTASWPPWENGRVLTPAERKRYARHLVLPEVGPEGQERLKAGSVALVGAGGLGSPAALYLAAAGVGRIGLLDFDAVDGTNLQRQVLYGTSDVGRPKVEAAIERLTDLNPHVEIVPHPIRLEAGNALEILERYDVVVDGADNFGARYVVNDACVLLGKPNVHGSIHRFEGLASVFWAGRGPCYRCLYPEPPPPGEVPSCAEGGVLGVLPGVVGTIQAIEALKILLGIGEPLLGRLLVFDALAMSFHEMAIRRDPGCALCGESPTIREVADLPAAYCAGEAAAPADADGLAPWEISAEGLKSRLDRGDPLLVVDVRTPGEWEIAKIPGAVLIPMQELPQRARELDREAEIVLYCHVGGRSAFALRWLRSRGYESAKHLVGGIDAWSTDVDPAVPRY